MHGKAAAEPAPTSTAHQGHHAGEDRMVFAHYMVGLTDKQTPEQWTTDIKSAKSAAIDGFALNIGPRDSYTEEQLKHAYHAAELENARCAAELDHAHHAAEPGHAHHAAEKRRGFVLFLSFDMAGPHPWAVDQVATLIREFRGRSAQARVERRPLVSTFEGPGWADNWGAVRESVLKKGGEDIFLMPCWTSLGARDVAGKAGLIDGAFSWEAWPQPGSQKMGSEADHLYKEFLVEKKKKKYMMGVSPWFYTTVWGKNWYSSSEGLWFDRWKQVLDVRPDFVQIITWNDFSESSYIADVNEDQIVKGAEKYVIGHSHAALRALLPAFIAAYKAGKPSVTLPHDQQAFAVAWYRTTPSRCGPDGGTKWGQGGQESAAKGAKDVVSVVVMAHDKARVTVAIGENPSQEFPVSGGATPLEVPFQGREGPVMLCMDGRTAKGPAISNTCPPREHVLFNSVSIKV